MASPKRNVRLQIEYDLSRKALEPSSTPEEREASQWGLSLLRRVPTNPHTYHMQGVIL